MKKINVLTLCAAAVLSMSATVNAEYNKYNEESYINLSNRTISDICEESGITPEEFLEMYDLPLDMPEDTSETAAYYNLTLKAYAEGNGVTVDEVLEYLNEIIPSNDFNEKTNLGEMEAEVPIGVYMISPTDPDTNYIEKYLGSDVPEDTKYGTVRTKVDRKRLFETGILSYFNEDDILVMLGGKYIDFDVAPTIVNDRTMVPLRGVFEKMGAVINWDDETKTVFAKKGDKTIILQVGQNVMFVNDTPIELDAPAVIADGRTLVPLRAVAEAMDTKVFYNADTKTVVIH